VSYLLRKNSRTTDSPLLRRFMTLMRTAPDTLPNVRAAEAGTASRSSLRAASAHMRTISVRHVQLCMCMRTAAKAPA